MRLIDLVFVEGRFDIEGEPDDPTQVFVLDLYEDDRAKLHGLTKGFLVELRRSPTTHPST